ncbi:transglutaminaseTgpA domain-containing protein [Nocardioides sp.]|uniref:transglutaminase family protein n=1 Tax=Nocardioides sp. TaxID=35761 RepID=UPI0039E4AF11
MRARDAALIPILLSLTCVVTVWLTTLSWRGFSADPGGYLRPLLAVGLVVAVTGLVARWAKLPAPPVALAQLLLGGAAVTLTLTGSPIPYGGALADLRLQFHAAVEVVRTLPPPVPVTDGIAPLLLYGGLGCFVLVDLFACTLRRAALAGLLLLAVYAVPFSVVDEALPWLGFACSAAGFLGMLALQESASVARWGRRLADGWDNTGRLTGGAMQIGAVATALAVVLPVFVPTLDLDVLGFGPGGGNDHRIQVADPVANMRRDLTRGADEPVLEVTTDDPRPSYLRIAVLNRFRDEEWSAGDRTVPANNDADGTLPALLGVAASVPRRSYSYQVEIGDNFDSRWLPTQAPISEIHAAGDWRYDTRTMDFLAGQKGLDAAGLSYDMTAVDLDLTTAQLLDSVTSIGTVGQSYVELPDDFPTMAADLAEQVTAEVDSPFEKAVALQSFFRETGGFTYDLDTPLGTGSGDLESFLTEPGQDNPEGRRGYCQQFATAMAAMARSLGIPARVAVGFLQPESVRPNVWVYSTHDLHAWPELFFAGAGWVRFEPTPAARATSVPSYTRGLDSVRRQQPSSTASSAAPTRQPSQAPQLPEQEQTSTATPDTGVSPLWWWSLGALGALAVLGLIALVPSRIRRRRRALRLRSLTPEAAWLELHDTVVDLGLRWPSGLSPRATGQALERYVGGDANREALTRLVGLVERSRYSTRAPEPASDDDLLRVLSALGRAVPVRAQRRAQWWPRSVTRWRSVPEAATERELIG